MKMCKILVCNLLNIINILQIYINKSVKFCLQNWQTTLIKNNPQVILFSLDKIHFLSVPRKKRSSLNDKFVCKEPKTGETNKQTNRIRQTNFSRQEISDKI